MKNKYGAGLLWVVYMYAAVLAVFTCVDVINHSELLRKDAYLKSKAFNDQLALHWNLIRYSIENTNFPTLTDDEKINAARMAAWQEEYAAMVKRGKTNVREGYRERIAEAQNLGKLDEVKRLEEGRDKGLTEVELEIPKLMETRKKEYLAYKNKEWSDVQTSLAARDGAFEFYIRNKMVDRKFMNMAQEPTALEMNQALFSIKLPQTDVESPLLKGISKYFQTNQLEGYFVIPRTAPGFSQIHADYVYFNSLRERVIKEFALLAINLLILGGLSWYLRRGHNRGIFGELRLNWVRQLPLDVRIAATILLFFVVIGEAFSNSLFQLPIRFDTFQELTFQTVTSGLLVLFVIDCLRLNKKEWREQWERSLIRRMAVLAGDRQVSKSMRYKAGLTFFLTVLLGVCLVLIVVGLGDEAPELFFLGLIYMLFYGVFVLRPGYKKLAMFQQIAGSVEQMAAGNLNESLAVKGRGKMAELAHHLNNMKQGFKASLEKEMKSERMKSELITNVSHDLKTPLTSIINYVDLLKQKDLPQETIADYVDVVDRKTQRLKVLIDDLFEASKMSSGAVELQVETVNVSSLLSQALAEFSDKIENSAATFRVNIQHPQITAVLDGRKTWRIFENLISNALKYAMPNTRVHLALLEDQEHVYFTIKNVSAYEIDFEVEELFERFKRGDQSRHTEGSGLGLAIAKSIAELQGGELKIEMDGDLFKVTVTFSRKLLE